MDPLRMSFLVKLAFLSLWIAIPFTVKLSLSKMDTFRTSTPRGIFWARQRNARLEERSKSKF